VCPSLAHRTVRCATRQCPVHQGLQLRTAHLREFWRPLRYNSPDCPVMHRTVSGGAPDCPVCQRSNGYFRANGRLQQHSMHYSARRCQARARRRTRQSTGPVRCPRRQKLQRSESNGQVTWQAHRTVSGAPCDSSLHQTASLVVGAINTPNHPPFIASKFSNFLHLTRAIAFNTRHTKEIKSSPKSIVHSKSNSD
jgi:hypothetical protein